VQMQKESCFARAIGPEHSKIFFPGELERDIVQSLCAIQVLECKAAYFKEGMHRLCEVQTNEQSNTHADDEAFTQAKAREAGTCEVSGEAPAAHCLVYHGCPLERS